MSPTFPSNACKAHTASIDYRLYEIAGRPVFAVPETPRDMRVAALARFQASTLKRAVFRFAVRLGMLVGADFLLSRPVRLDNLPGMKDNILGQFLERWASLLGSGPIRGAVFWPPQPERGRIYVHLFSHGRAVAFAKIALTPSEAVRIQNEGDVLRELARRSLPRELRIPRVIAQGEFNSATCLLMEALPLRFHQPSEPFPISHIRELGPVRHVGADTLSELSWWKRYASNLTNADLTFHSELMAVCQDRTFAVCRAHGDLGPANMAHDGESFWLFDWEASAPDAPSHTDMLGLELAQDLPFTLAHPAARLRMLKAKHLAAATPHHRLAVMMALAFRHSVGLPDATALIRQWEHSK